MKEKTKKVDWIEVAEMVVLQILGCCFIVSGFLGFVGGLILLCAGTIISSKLIIYFGSGALISSMMCTILYSYAYCKLFEKEEKNGNKSK